MYSIEAIKAAYPIDKYLRDVGIQVSDHGGKPKCLCPFHDDHNPSMSIRLDKQDWRCWACGIGGSVIDLYMRLNNSDLKSAIKEMAEKAGIPDDHNGRKHTAATYQYKNERGKLVMCVDRIEEGMEKSFSQYTMNDSGERVNSVKDVKKVLYRLEHWANESEVCLCEGEKCVAALEELGMAATTNPGGSSAWLDAYSFYLEGKHVNIWPDNDNPGNKWLDAVLASLTNKVESLRILRVPKPYNDVADVLLAQGREIGSETILNLMRDTKRMPKGLDIPVLSADDMYSMYSKRVRESKNGCVDLSKWLPSFKSSIRPLLPGDLVVLLSDTGVGKTTILANIAYSQRPNPVLFFELELTAEDMCERLLQLDCARSGQDVEAEVVNGIRHNTGRWSNIYVCPKSKVTIDELEGIIKLSELVIGDKPKLVIVDYIGLMHGKDSKRYERMSNIAEGLKVIAKNTGTVVMVSSQIHRDKERSEISLHDAKDSGSIEASAQLVLGAMRPEQNLMKIKLLKCTKSSTGITIDCSFDGNRQKISEIGVSGGARQ